MARKIVFEVITKAQLGALKNLADTLDDITASAKAMGRVQGLNQLENELKKVASVAERTKKALNMGPKQLDTTYGDQARRAARDVETLSTRLKDLAKDQSRLDAIRRKSKSLPEDLARAEQDLADAITRTAQARAKLTAAERKGATQTDLDDASKAYKEADVAMRKAQKTADTLGKELHSTGQEVSDIERRFSDLTGSLAAVRNKAGGKKLVEDLMPKGDANRIQEMEQSLKSLANVFTQTHNPARALFSTLSKNVTTAAADFSRLDSATSKIKALRTEMVAASRVDTKLMQQQIGSPTTAITATMNALRNQNEQMISMRNTMGRLMGAEHDWANAENMARNALARGNEALQERMNVQRAYQQALRGTTAQEKALMTQRDNLARQQRQLADEQTALTNRVNAAQTNLMRQPAGTAAYRDAENQLNQLRTAYTQLDNAIDQNTTNIRENATAIKAAGTQVSGIQNDMRAWDTTMNSLRASMKTVAPPNLFGNLMGQLQSITRLAASLATAFGGRLRSAISAAANATKSFLGSGASMFSGIQRALNATGNMFTAFSAKVQASMQRSRSAMMELYAAGFSMTMLGRDIQQFGLSGFRAMDRSLQGYMEYERLRNQAAIAAAESAKQYTARTGQPAPAPYVVNTQIIDEIVRGLQRGTMTPEWLSGGKRLPVAFDAKDLAQGLYYYSSAIGQPITEANKEAVGGVVSTIMQMARVTNTGIESAMKGVLNIAMEFGYDPRDLSATGAQDISKIAAQVGYLANISTMEVADIVQMFKMVGPMVHELVGDEKGAGLEDTFLLSFLASEVGLRGGNVGRGINQALTSLLDPSQDMLDSMGEFFPDIIDASTGAATQANFMAKFFDDSGKLKGGLLGFLENIAALPEEVQMQALASMFTTNATRALIGPLGPIGSGTLANGQTLTEWLEEIKSDAPMEWLAAAAATTADSVNGSFMFMQNGWFQFQASIIDSVSGPLKGAFMTVGEVMFEFAERIQLNPAIGQTITAIVAAVSSLGAVLGTLVIGAGAILLIGRSFAVAGGMVLPFIRMMAFAGVTLLGLIPIIGLIAVAAGLLHAAFESNFLGIADAVESVKFAFANFDTVITPAIESVFDWLTRLTMAFDEFINVILLGGAGPADNLFAMLQSVFGPMLGGAMIQGLLEFSENLTGTRQSFNEFVSGLSLDAQKLKGVGLVVQGFLEQLFLGTHRPETGAAMGAFGEALGLDNFEQMVSNAADSVRNFVNIAVASARQVASVWISMTTQIWSNISRIFNQQSIFATIGTLLRGAFIGVVAAINVVLGSVVFITDKIADFAEGLHDAAAAGETIMGFAIDFNDVLMALGATIGVFFGAKLLLAFSPFAALLVNIIPMITSFAAVVVGLGGKFIILAAQIAVTTAAWLAQMAVMGAMLAVKATLMVLEAAFAAAQTATTAGSAAQTGIIGLLAAAYATLTGAAGAATGVMATFAAVVTVVLAVVAALVAAFAVIAAMMFAIAGAVIIATAVTQGLGAAFAQLMSFAQGVWAGLQIVIVAIMSFVSIMQSLAGMVGAITGLGDSLFVMGVIAGAALSGMIILIGAVILAFAALAVAAVAVVAVLVAGFALLLAPLILLVAGIALVADALFGLDGPIGAVADAFDALWSHILEGANLLGARIVDSLTGAFADAVNDIVNSLSDSGLLGKFNKATGGSLEADFEGTHYVEDFLADRARRDATASMYNNLPPSSIGNVALTTTHEAEGFMGFLDQIGVGGTAREFLVSIGIDPTNFELSDLSADNMMDFLSIPTSEEAMRQYGFGTVMDAYEKDVDRWKDYNNLVASVGKPSADAAFRLAGIEIPTEEPAIADYFMGIADDANMYGDEAAAAIEAKMAEIEQAFQGLKGMTAEDFLGAVFDPLAGQGGKSIASWFAGGGAQPILDAIGDAAPWMNQMELMADVAGTGLDLSTNVYGQNLQSTLAPYMEILSQQTGIAVSDLMANIPKFIAPEEFMGVAAGELMMGISTLGPELFKNIDTLGQDFLDAAGVPMEEFGLEWAELQAYAVGNAVAGTDWNLADYLSDSWGISVAEAEGYLASHGIDPNVITDTWFEATEAAALTGNGAYSVMTQEMYDFLAAETNGFMTDVISMTEAEWNRIPPAYRAVMANMGITTIIEEGLSFEDATAAVTQQTSELVTAVQAAGTSLGRAGANFVMEGGPEDWIPLETFRSATGEMMVILEDLDGTQVTIPAVEYGDYTRSLYDLEQVTNDAKRALLDHYKDIYGPREAGDSLIPSFRPEDKGPQMTQAQVAQSLGLPTPQQVDAYMGDVQTQIRTGLSGLTTEVSGGRAGGGGTIEIPISLNFDTFNGDLAWIQTSLAMLEGATGSIEIPISLQFDTFNGDLMWIQTSLAMLQGASGSVEIPISLQFDTFYADLQWIQTSISMLGGEGGIEIPISINIDQGSVEYYNSLASSLNDFSATPVTISISLQIDQGNVEYYNTLMTSLNDFSMTPVTVTVNLVATGSEVLTQIQQKLMYISTGSWPITITANAMAASSAIQGVQTKLDTLMGGNAYNAVVTASTGQATSAIEAVLQKLRYLTAGSWMATIGVNDNASGTISNAISLLNSFAGRTAVSTIQVNTVQTTTQRTLIAAPVRVGATAATGGWRAAGQSVLVGEEGPEVVYFPKDGYVFTANETQGMLSKQLGATGATNPFLSSSNADKSEGSTTIGQVGDTFHFHGDIIIGDKATAKDFFAEIDKRMGRKNQLAKRGQISVDETKMW